MPNNPFLFFADKFSQINFCFRELDQLGLPSVPENETLTYRVKLFYRIACTCYPALFVQFFTDPSILILNFILRGEYIVHPTFMAS